MENIIKGVIVSPLKIIFHPQGDILHGMKRSDSGYAGFGEAYFSIIKKSEKKAWKKHLKMTLNFVVPVGEIQFVIYDDRNNSETKGQFYSIMLSHNNYCRLTVPPRLWMGFKGIGESNILLNVANMEHMPEEIERLEFNKIKYDWEK